MKLKHSIAQEARRKLFDACITHVKTPVHNLINVAPMPKVTDTSPEIMLTDVDTISACRDIKDKDKDAKICVLNFASYKHPGGGFMSDMMAQEESLCYCTNLYENLDACREWYESHRELNRGCYTNQSILSRGITVVAYDLGLIMPEDECFTIDILTCAAPNLNYAIKSNNIALIQDMKGYMDDRIKYILQIMSSYDYDYVVLGAFGCGVFRNDPFTVAECFKNHLHGAPFKAAVFAVPNKESQNYKAFERTFKNA